MPGTLECRDFNFGRVRSGSSGLVIIKTKPATFNYLNICYQNEPRLLIGLGKQCRPRSDCSSKSSLIRVYTVCSSVYIFLKHYHMPVNFQSGKVKSESSGHIIIKTNLQQGIILMFLFLL